MAYALLYTTTSSDLPSETNVSSQIPLSKCLSSSDTLNFKNSSETSLISPSNSVKAQVYSSCPGSFSVSKDTFDCPGDVCIRCQDGAVTIDNRCVCLCQTEDCMHTSLSLKHYFPFDQLCRPSLELQAHRLLENEYSSGMDEEMTNEGRGELRFSYGDSTSSDDDDTSSSDSSSSYSTQTSSSSSSSSPSESNNSPMTACS